MKKSWLLPPRESAYERDIYIFLSVFRFLSFALAIALIFTIPRQPLEEWQMAFTTSVIGGYTLLKVLFRFRLWQRASFTYSILGIDLVICLAAVLLTGGIDSPFLLYSLLPVITSALFFNTGISLVMATLISLNLVVAHVWLAGTNLGIVPILQGNYLSFVLMFGIFSFLIATITSRTNLNIYRHIQGDTIVEERRRLRQEIHDNIAQTLGYIRTKTNLLKSSLPSSEGKLLAELEEIHKVTSESYQDIRETIDSLDVKVESVSLINGLSDQIKQLGKRTGIKIDFAAPQQPLPLHPVAQLHLLRICQEALNNVRKHASASEVQVRLECTPLATELVVKDDGRGFSYPAQKGTGLKIMEERANSSGGILTVTSTNGQGTEIKVKIPKR